MFIEKSDMVMQWIQSMASGNAFSETTARVTNNMILVAEVLTPIIVLGSIGWNYLSNAVKTALGGESSQFVDYVQIARALSIMALIGLWRLLYPILILVTSTFNQLTDLDDDSNRLLIERQKMLKQATYVSQEQKDEIAVSDLLSDPNVDEKQKEAALAFAEDLKFADAAVKRAKNQEENSSEELVKDKSLTAQEVRDEQTAYGKLLYNFNPQTWGPSIFQAIIEFLSGIVRLIVGFFALMVSRILIIIGPLAMMVSIIPMFRNKIDEWFGALLPTLLVFTSINIIDNIRAEMMEVFYNDYYKALSSGANAGEMIINTTTTAHMMTALEFVTLIAYAMAFWLTAKWIGKSDAGAFMSKSIAVGMGAVALGAKVLGGSMGGGAGAGGKSVNSMLNSIHREVSNMAKDKGGSQSGGNSKSPLEG